MSEPARVTALILAGGKSRRMGRDKAFIEFEGKPLIARVIERVQPVCAETLIIANDADLYAPFGLRVVGDVYPDKGSLGGIYSGLLSAREEYALAVACDMPFLNEGLLRYLISLAPHADVIVPHAVDPSSNPAHTGKRANKTLAKSRDWHPMHAVYSKRCLDAMRAHLLADDLRLISFFDDVRVRVVESDQVDRFDPQHLSFFNANTPEDFQIALSLGQTVR
ncbi:MAG: molybdenum cofactor guanylyltransferase [Chloroflexi bacterium]|nr:molybdenum cofactor guanylyltransferase [Chloroflexota bacterium]